MAFKVAFIGAGSIGFTRTLLRDLLTVPEFRDIEVAFTDINAHNLDMVRQLCQRDVDSNGLKIHIEANTDRRAALKNEGRLETDFRPNSTPEPAAAQQKPKSTEAK